MKAGRERHLKRKRGLRDEPMGREGQNAKWADGHCYRRSDGRNQLHLDGVGRQDEKEDEQEERRKVWMGGWVG